MLCMYTESSFDSSVRLVHVPQWQTFRLTQTGADFLVLAPFMMVLQQCQSTEQISEYDWNQWKSPIGTSLLLVHQLTPEEQNACFLLWSASASNHYVVVPNSNVQMHHYVDAVDDKTWVSWICLWQNEAMRVVYRMRGLLGDATEDMVNSLDSGRGLLKNSHYKQCRLVSLRISAVTYILCLTLHRVVLYSL